MSIRDQNPILVMLVGLFVLIPIFYLKAFAFVYVWNTFIPALTNITYVPSHTLVVGGLLMFRIMNPKLNEAADERESIMRVVAADIIQPILICILAAIVAFFFI